jgi:hypothetical protein
MAILRYILYFFGVATITWLLAHLEISSPGSLKLQIFSNAADTLGTSEYSPIEIIQPGILAICGLLLAWVAANCPSQRPVAFLFGGMALVFFIRELDFFLDQIADNLWQVLVAVPTALVIAYTYRHRKRFRIAWGRVWPSPGLAILFSGAIVMFAFVQIVSNEELWLAILGDHYRRVVKLSVEEFMELAAYYLWLIGTIEYTYQARFIAMREPQPAVVKRRKGRQPKPRGRY